MLFFSLDFAFSQNFIFSLKSFLYFIIFLSKSLFFLKKKILLINFFIKSFLIKKIFLSKNFIEKKFLSEKKKLSKKKKNLYKKNKIVSNFFSEEKIILSLFLYKYLHVYYVSLLNLHKVLVIFCCSHVLPYCDIPWS